MHKSLKCLMCDNRRRTAPLLVDGEIDRIAAAITEGIYHDGAKYWLAHILGLQPERYCSLDCCMRGNGLVCARCGRAADVASVTVFSLPEEAWKRSQKKGWPSVTASPYWNYSDRVILESYEELSVRLNDANIMSLKCECRQAVYCSIHCCSIVVHDAVAAEIGRAAEVRNQLLRERELKCLRKLKHLLPKTRVAFREAANREALQSLKVAYEQVVNTLQ